MILPAQFANEVHDGEKILFCPYCSRILYYQEVEDEDVDNYFSMAEAGTLAFMDEDYSEEDEEEDDDSLVEDSDLEDDVIDDEVDDEEYEEEPEEDDNN